MVRSPRLASNHPLLHLKREKFGVKNLLSHLRIQHKFFGSQKKLTPNFSYQKNESCGINMKRHKYTKGKQPQNNSVILIHRRDKI